MNAVILIKKGGGTGPTKPWQPFNSLIPVPIPFPKFYLEIDK